ncbi:TonB-dependent receptor [Russula earlei]|uniref:TonB-dependent receptor n=1 Tax=Russula earlei TaxID=71964 RepID=A0ACC0TXN2_9AGAM|nr:TonB-dependent receptor [Russula earlei]
MIRKRLQQGLLLFLITGFSVVQAQKITNDIPGGTTPSKASKKSQNPITDTTVTRQSSQGETYDVLYQVRKRKLTTGSMVEIYNKDLLKTQTPSYGGMLAGRVAGLYTTQASGEPGNDDITGTIRGQAPLVLVDGAPQSFPSINPEQIESITVLKDALSTVMLGSRSSGGAILITTKKSAGGASQRLEFTALQGIQAPTRMPQFLDAYNYASLYNEALANDGKPAAFTQADLDAYKNGTDPAGHPNIDWKKQILKNTAPYGRYDLSFSGTAKSVRYFANLDYLNQGGLFQTLSSNTYNTNADYQRYIFRSNVEMDLNSFLTASLNLFGRIQNTNQPGATTATIFSGLLSTPNSAYPIRNADSSIAGSQNYQNNLYAQTMLSGYQPVYERDFKADMTLKGNLDRIAKGLWIKALVAVNAYERETTNRSKSVAVFRPYTDPATGIISYTQYGTNGTQANTISVSSQNRLTYSELSMGYSKKMGNHNITALVMYNNDNRLVNSNLPVNYSGVAGKVSYDYAQKYLVEIAAGYQGSELYPSGKRYGLFPAIGLGWNITNENFLKNRPDWLNNLKLRATYGKTGNANAGYYVYNQYYVTGTGYGFGTTVPSSTTTYTQGALANPNITWEKAKKLNAGIDADLFSNRLNFTLDYFNENYYDLLQQRGDLSAVAAAPQLQNIGKDRYNGIELQATWHASKGAFSYFISPNFSILKSKVTYMAEPAYANAWLQHTGQPVGQLFGYVAEGLFQSAADISSHAYQGAGIVPGDIKYKDLNNDGKIDGNDQTAIGSTKPLMYYGLNTGISYKGFDLSVLFQGVANDNLQLTGSGYWGFMNNGLGQAYQQQLNRWTPTNPNATYPRLWLGNNTNNMAASSYWVHTGNYVRVKNIELGYTFPASLIKKTGLTEARFFLNATNLFTFTSSALKNTDPEDYNYLYPIMKVVTAGLNIKL